MSSPSLYFYTGWKEVDPSPTAGGPKVLQQHVRILRKNGYDARIVLGRRTGWWSRLSSRDEDLALSKDSFARAVGPADVVVVPSVLCDGLDGIPGRRKVIMVQNGGLLFNSLTLENREAYPWLRPEVEGIICVSEHDRKLVELAAPSCPVHRVFNAVVPERFTPRPWEERENLVLASPLLPYKNPWHTAAICHVVRSRGLARAEAGDGTRPAPTVRVIQGLSPPEVVDLLERAKVLVFLSVSEGFALLPMEAILAGTPVVAYRGQAYEEFLPDAYLHELSDFEGLVDTVERILALGPGDPSHRNREDARVHALAYSGTRQEESVLAVWRAILEGA